MADNPWLTRRTLRPLRSDWIERSSSMRGKPDLQFYRQFAPRWAEGEAMLICVRLDFGDMLRGLANVAKTGDGDPGGTGLTPGAVVTMAR